MTQLQKFISILNLSIKTNSFFFKFSKTKFVLQLVKLLIKHNYFIGYKNCTIDSSKVIIFIKLNLEWNKSLIVSCKQVSNTSRTTYVRFTQLPQSSSSLWVLSTVKGIMTHKEA